MAFHREPFSKVAVYRGFSALYHVAPAGEGYHPVPASVISVPLTYQDRAVWSLGSKESVTGEIRPGSVFVTAAGPLVWSRWESTECVHIAVSRSDLPALRDAMLVEDPVLFHLAQVLKAEVLADSPGGELFADSLGAALTAHLLRNYSEPALPKSLRIESLTPRDMRVVIELIDARLSDKITLGEMAAAVHMSPYHFLRSFKAFTGLPPHRYVMQRRVERAKTLLARADLSMEEIAERTGFSSSSHLTAFFRRHFESTPSAWRREKFG